MPSSFRLEHFDATFAARTTPQDWQRILVLRDHPSLLKGLTSYDALIPAYFSNNLILNKVVTEAWRFQILVYALHLHDTRDPSDPRTGLTYSSLQKICARQNIASAGRVSAILGLMRLGGYVKAQRSALDSRIVHLVPSEKFVMVVEGWNRCIFQIIDAITPDARLTACHKEQPGFGREMRRRGAETLLSGWNLLDPFPEVFHFVSSDGGWMLLLTCIAETVRTSSGGQIAPVAIDLQPFGKRFGVSRSHLRQLLQSAFEAGLLDAPPRNGAHILLSPQLIASFLACMASELGNYRLWGLAARDAT